MTANALRIPDLDAIARNLTYLDLDHLSPAEAADYEHELSAIASLNDALDTAALALTTSNHPQLWQQLTPMLSDAAALLSSQLAPLIDLDAERDLARQLNEQPTQRPLALTHR